MIDNHIAHLTLYVESDVHLKSTGTNAPCIFLHQSLKITGPGMLTICSKMSGIRGADNNRYALTIESARVDIKEAQKGKGGIIYCSKLDVTDSYLHSVDTIVQCGTIDLHDCAVTEPAGAVVKPSNCGSVCTSSSGTNLAKNIVITKTYGFKVGGKYVTRENKDDILGNGVFYYEPDENRLTVNGKYSCSDFVIENENAADLTIYVARDSELKSSSNYAIFAHRDTKITGPGKLTLKGYGGIALQDSNLLIDNARLQIEADYGIHKTYLSVKARLTVKDSYVRIKSNVGFAVNCNKIILDGCDIVLPEQGFISAGTVCSKNDEPAKDVTFNSFFDLYISGSQISAMTAYNIGNGAFKYDAAANILFIYESYTASGNYPAIENLIPGLTIYTVYDATLSSSTAALLLKADTAITGTGVLSLSGTSCGIFVRDAAKLTVNKAVMLVGGGDGIMGISPSDGASLYIRSSRMIIASTDNAAVFNLASITLNDSIITSPSGAYIQGGDILQSNGAYAKTVTIGVPMTTIETVNLEIPKPVAGNTISYSANAVNADGYEIEYDYGNTTWSSGVIWKENSTTLNVSNANTFKTGNTYTVTVSIVITDADRYKFAEVGSLKAYINGYEAEVVKYTSTNYGIRYTFDLTPPQAVTDIYVTIPEPEAGDLIYYYAKVPEGCGYRVQTELNNGLLWESGVAWYCDGSPLCPQDDEYFVNGGDYRVEISIVLTDEDRYEFGNLMDMYIIVNGHYADYTKVSDTKIIVCYYFTVEAEPIDEILIYNYYPPAVGQKAGESENSVIYDSRFSIAVTDWYCDTDHRYMNSDEVFESGKLYSHRWILKATEGYEFDDDYVYVTINYETDLLDFNYCSIGDSPSEYTVWTVPAEPVNMISEVRINGYTAPTVGQTASENLASLSLPSGANYRVTFINWIVAGEETPMNASDIFENGKEYYISFSIEPKDGYSFCGQMPEVYINGIRELVGSARLYEYDDVLDGTTVLASFGTVIEEITVLGFKVPKPGQTVNEVSASITAPDGAHYSFVYIFWYEYHGNGQRLSGDCVFEAGKTYDVYVGAIPETGYRFISPSVIIEGGQKYLNEGSCWLYFDGEYGIWLTGIEVTASSDIKYGDVNGDGKVNGQDLVRLRKYLNGENVDIGPGANVNGDAEGKVNGQDLIRLRKYLNGENVVLGPN